MTNREHREQLTALDRDWGRLSLRAVDKTLVRLAGELAERHALRGFDAIHLASAVTLQRELGERVTFLAADDRLVSAAANEGLET